MEHFGIEYKTNSGLRVYAYSEEVMNNLWNRAALHKNPTFVPIRRVKNCSGEWQNYIDSTEEKTVKNTGSEFAIRYANGKVSLYSEAAARTLWKSRQNQTNNKPQELYRVSLQSVEKARPDFRPGQVVELLGSYSGSSVYAMFCVGEYGSLYWQLSNAITNYKWSGARTSISTEALVRIGYKELYS